MCLFNYFRIQKAKRDIRLQIKALSQPKFYPFSWKPLTLSILNEYIGSDDEIYLAVSSIDFAKPAPSNIPEEERKDWNLLLIGVVIQHLNQAIRRIELGKILPQRHNFFCRIPLTVAVAISIAILVTVPTTFYYWGQHSGHSEYDEKVESQSVTIKKVTHERDSLFALLSAERDRLPKGEPEQKHPD